MAVGKSAGTGEPDDAPVTTRSARSNTTICRGVAACRRGRPAEPGAARIQECGNGRQRGEHPSRGEPERGTEAQERQRDTKSHQQRRNRVLHDGHLQRAIIAESAGRSPRGATFAGPAV